jgi:glutathione S-transferase
MSGFLIHGSEFSPYVQAVLITLAEKGETGTVQPLAPGGMKAEPHLSRHPFGMIPVLEHGDFELYETQAIVRYLDRLIPAPALTPVDIHQAARMDQAMNITDQYLFNGVNRIIGFQRIVGPMLMGLEPDVAVIAEAMSRARRVFKVLNDLLAGQAYFAGDALSLADIMVIPHIAMLAITPEWAELTASNPNLIAWQTRMHERPSLSKIAVPTATPAAV